MVGDDEDAGIRSCTQGSTRHLSVSMRVSARKTQLGNYQALVPSLDGVALGGRS